MFVKQLNILIADDESLIRLGLKRILEEAGHTVYAAENGLAAIKLTEGLTPDLVILDIKMPEMDGLEAARLILERLQVPIIFLTAYGERELVERAARLPVMGYLVKPIKEAELLAMIEVSAQRYQEHAQIAQSAAELENEVTARRTIDRAKGLLMQAQGISEYDAYQILEHRARSERRTLLEAAETSIQETEKLLD
jgi:AmiR/NasT family two-component response regulator